MKKTQNPQNKIIEKNGSFVLLEMFSDNKYHKTAEITSMGWLKMPRGTHANPSDILDLIRRSKHV